MQTASGRDWAAYLDSAMRSAGLTQAELARRSGLAESMVSRWLRGLNQPDVPNLRRVRPALGVPMLELIVAAGYLTLEEAELRDSPEPPEPVRIGLSTEGLTAEQVRQLEGYATFLRAQNRAEATQELPAIQELPAAQELPAEEETAEPLRYAAFGGAKLSREQEARVREQARLAREAAERSGEPVVFLDDPEDPRR
jgi:transcriptional regulator with XRE-family HTH domain